MSIYKGTTLIAGTVPNSVNKDLSNLSSTGQAVIDNKANVSLDNINNTGKIAITHNAMPSSTSSTLSLQSSGSSYTAPADGWVHITLRTNTGGYVAVKDIYNQQANANGNDVSVFCPVRKGESFTVKYSNRTSTPRFRFYYAVGTESEAT